MNCDCPKGHCSCSSRRATVNVNVSQRARVLAVNVIENSIEKRRNQRALIKQEILDLESSLRLLREMI